MDRCRASADGALLCSFDGGAERVIALPFAVRATASRAAGGAYALGAEGELVRLGPQGTITGAFETGLVSLTTSEDYVCGIDGEGEVLCARDHHHDRFCPGVALPALEHAMPGSGPVQDLRGRSGGALLCATDARGTEHCRSGLARCERICLSYPACAPVRCVDPCSESGATAHAL